MNPATVSWLGYGWETSFAAVSTTINKAFGHGVRTTSMTRRNNVEKVFSQGFRNAQVLKEKKFEGAITVEFVLANPWFFKAIMGAVTTTGSGPYTHTFTESDSVPTFSIKNNIATTTPSVPVLLGANAATCTLTSAVNELVRVRLDMPYGNETFSATTSSKLTDTEDLFTFANGSLELPNGSTLAQVQNMEVVLANSPELIMGQGSRFAQENAVKQRDYSGSITMALQASADLLQKCYGGATGPADSITETASMVMNFTNGQTGTNERSITATFTGVKIDEDSLPQDPTAVIMEDVSVFMRDLELKSINNTETAL